MENRGICLFHNTSANWVVLLIVLFLLQLFPTLFMTLKAFQYFIILSHRNKSWKFRPQIHEHYIHGCMKHSPQDTDKLTLFKSTCWLEDVCKRITVCFYINSGKVLWRNVSEIKCVLNQSITWSYLFSSVVHQSSISVFALKKQDSTINLWKGKKKLYRNNGNFVWFVSSISNQRFMTTLIHMRNSWKRKTRK